MEYTSAGDAHGQALVAVVTGAPAGLRLSLEQVQSDLARCVAGYQVPENALQYVEVNSGMFGRNTTGAPLTFLVYGDASASRSDESVPGDVPRPGTGDLPAFLKTAADSVDAVRARRDASDEAACVVAASVPREFLAQLGVEVASFVTRIGKAALPDDETHAHALVVGGLAYSPMDIEFSPVRCPNKHVSQNMEQCISAARAAGETLGGTFQLVVTGLLPGLGDYAQRKQRLNAQLASALFSLTGVTAVEFGEGGMRAQEAGPACHDAITMDASQGFSYASNRAGGIEDGLTTGEPLVITVDVAANAPTKKGAASVNLDTLQKEEARAQGENTPVCTVPGVAVAAEAEVAFVLANAYFSQFGSANMTDITASVSLYKQRLRRAAR